jgi:ABC-type nitrate/sulfonate/bicarbonate transport system permease component
MEFLRRLAWLRNFGLVAIILIVWQFFSGYVFPRTHPSFVTLMPPPTAVAAAAWDLITSGELAMQAWASFQREFVAFAAAALTAIPLGMAMGWWRSVYNQMMPLTELLRPMPPLAWIPLGILWFGVGNTENEFIIFLAVFFPVLINTIAGIRSVDVQMIRAARSLGANESAVLFRVAWNAALPQIFTGLRVGFGIGWMALVAAEITGARTGLGFLMWDSRNFLRTDIIITCMITIGLLGLAFDQGLQLTMRLLLPWWRESR